MFGRKNRPTGPDFSGVTAEEAHRMVARGQLEKLYLLPPEFGGADIPQNTLFVPLGIADAKRRIDEGIIAPLARDGLISQYSATPEYAGESFIPIAIRIEAHGERSFAAAVAIWGEALAR
jgi:hypothetical protein